jgi:excinuclease UvrABC helicase subunit UvrB
MKAYERFLNYARTYTQSADEQGVTPSTPCQWDLARMLEKEMKEAARRLEFEIAAALRDEIIQLRGQN